MILVDFFLCAAGNIIACRKNPSSTDTKPIIITSSDFLPTSLPSYRTLCFPTASLPARVRGQGPSVRLSWNTCSCYGFRNILERIICCLRELFLHSQPETQPADETLWSATLQFNEQAKKFWAGLLSEVLFIGEADRRSNFVRIPPLFRFSLFCGAYRDSFCCAIKINHIFH